MDVIQGALAGAVAGLIASWAMERFQAAWYTTADHAPLHRVRPVAQSRMDLPQASATGGEPATIRVADAVAEPVVDRHLIHDERPMAGEVVHHGFGASMGALYGVLADVPFSPIRAFDGMLFGAALWLIVDEVAPLRAGPQRASAEFPSTTHAYRIASHLVYGLTLETVRRAIRWMA